MIEELNAKRLNALYIYNIYDAPLLLLLSYTCMYKCKWMQRHGMALVKDSEFSHTLSSRAKKCSSSRKKTQNVLLQNAVSCIIIRLRSHDLNLSCSGAVPGRSTYIIHICEIAMV